MIDIQSAIAELGEEEKKKEERKKERMNE